MRFTDSNGGSLHNVSNIGEILCVEDRGATTVVIARWTKFNPGGHRTDPFKPTDWSGWKMEKGQALNTVNEIALTQMIANIYAAIQSFEYTRCLLNKPETVSAKD